MKITIKDKLYNETTMMKGKMRDCPDCGAKPGTPHKVNCDVERCSVCGGQRLQCSCPRHDRALARWTGFWPGSLGDIAAKIATDQCCVYTNDAGQGSAGPSMIDPSEKTEKKLREIAICYLKEVARQQLGTCFVEIENETITVKGISSAAPAYKIAWAINSIAERLGYPWGSGNLTIAPEPKNGLDMEPAQRATLVLA